jgi:hypothetical protein
MGRQQGEPTATRAAFSKARAIGEAIVRRFVGAGATEVLGQMTIACRRLPSAARPS